VNFELSDEQALLREAASVALSRHKTIEAARDALDGGERLDLWDVARTAGWCGMLVGEDKGGAGLGALDAMLVMGQCGRVLASVALLGHLPATALLDASSGHDDLLSDLASGQKRACYVPAQPPGDLESEWTVEPAGGQERSTVPRIDGTSLSGTVHWVPDAPGADALVVSAVDRDGTPVAVVVEEGFEVEPMVRYDATRLLGHVRLDEARGVALDAVEVELRSAWYLAQALLAAESVGAVEIALEMATEYAKQRHTFGRAIGSYQAVKHGLVEVLRLLENARSLIYYAGWARQDAHEEFPLAASAARVAASKALDFAARELISVHGGIGATWEHDAPLYFRRAQLSRRLLGGVRSSADRVAGELLAATG
jgi:alkylation response protein AidB-like acyl-CoA dehydrogenase